MMSNQQKITIPTRQTPMAQTVAELHLVKAKTAIEQFIYSCSHTMRGPLKSIGGLVNLLKGTEGNPDVSATYYLQFIESSIAKLESVLDDLEQFLTNSAEDLKANTIDIREMLDDVLSEFQQTTEQKKINVAIVVNQSASLYGDRNCLRIILSHLLANAVAYQDDKKRKKQIDISVKINSTSCLVSIRDNGIGMQERIMSKMFQLFFRGSEKSAGAGVGLYIVHEVIGRVGGTITARSKPAKGSCFTFSIPNLSN
jgi:signal transduction histidine kinase